MAKKVDKSAWGAGPWQSEPDELTWTDEKTGYRCNVTRNYGGALCGYVEIPAGHPLHGVLFNNEIPETMKPLLDVVMDGTVGKRGPMQVFLAAGGVTRVDILFDVHGGVTFSDRFPADGKDGYWYGFDCSHCDDLSPGMNARYPSFGSGGEYRDIAYVQGECASLAKQLKQLAG